MTQSRFWPAEPEKRMILIITGALLLLSIVKSGYYTRAYGGTDLRSISVASKLLDSGRNAYFYRWSPGDPEQYLDPNTPLTTASNGVTVAPGTLYFLSLFSPLRYPVLRVVWTVILYLFALYILSFFFFQKDNSPEKRYAIAVIGVLLFLCSSVWFLNIERGQVYVLFAFLFTLIYQLYRSPKPWAQTLAGVVLALAVYCRPNFLLLLVPLLLVRNWRALSGWLGATLCLAVHAYDHLGLWKGYSAVINEFSDVAGPKPHIWRAPQTYPAGIEGVNNLTKFKNDFICGGISPLSSWLDASIGAQPFYLYLVVLVLIVIALVWIYRKRLIGADAPTVVLFGFLLYVTTEYIMPTSRTAYNLILWIFPVLLFLQQFRLSPRAVILLIAGLCLMNGFPFYFPYLQDLGEMLLIFVLLTKLRKR